MGGIGIYFSIPMERIFSFNTDAVAQRGMTMVAMEDELRESAETYNKLKESGVLVVRGLNLNRLP